MAQGLEETSTSLTLKNSITFTSFHLNPSWTTKLNIAVSNQLYYLTYGPIRKTSYTKLYFMLEKKRQEVFQMQSL